MTEKLWTVRYAIGSGLCLSTWVIPLLVVSHVVIGFSLGWGSSVVPVEQPYIAWGSCIYTLASFSTFQQTKGVIKEMSKLKGSYWLSRAL